MGTLPDAYTARDGVLEARRLRFCAARDHNDLYRHQALLLPLKLQPLHQANGVTIFAILFCYPCGIGAHRVRTPRRDHPVSGNGQDRLHFCTAYILVRNVDEGVLTYCFVI